MLVNDLNVLILPIFDSLSQNYQAFPLATVPEPLIEQPISQVPGISTKLVVKTRVQILLQHATAHNFAGKTVHL